MAHVGLDERQAHEKGIETSIYLQQLEEVDRAILEGEDAGFVKVLDEERIVTR